MNKTILRSKIHKSLNRKNKVQLEEILEFIQRKPSPKPIRYETKCGKIDGKKVQIFFPIYKEHKPNMFVSGKNGFWKTIKEKER